MDEMPPPRDPLDYEEPPPRRWDDEEPPPLDFGYVPEVDPFEPSPRDGAGDVPIETPSAPEIHDESPHPQLVVSDDGWAWYDARFVGVDRGEAAGDGRYEIGAVDLYANLHTGDLGGSYLPLQAFPDEPTATAYYHELEGTAHANDRYPADIPALAETLAHQLDPEHPGWQRAGTPEYEAYEVVRDLGSLDRDEPGDLLLDELTRTAAELGGVVVELEPTPEINPSAFNALDHIGLEAEALGDTPPPYYDPDTGTAYWIGVFQPDTDDPDNCVTSILSLGRNAEGAYEAQLAPCVPGDWDKTYAAAEHLIGLAEKGGMEPVFDAAEGMALATDQRAFWEAERGVRLAPDTAQEVADYTEREWEVTL